MYQNTYNGHLVHVVRAERDMLVLDDGSSWNRDFFNSLHQRVEEIVMIQETFSPMKYLKWTEEGWYELPADSTTKARKDRDARAKDLSAKGYRVKKFSMRNQLVKRGGIGTGHPEIERLVTVYGLNAWEK